MLPAEVTELFDNALEDEAFDGYEWSAINVGFLHLRVSVGSSFQSARICSS